MPFSLIRFNLIDPTLDSQSLSDRYKAMLDMAEFADQNGFFMATFEEHHGADNAWSPTPLMNAGTVLARTTTLSASISALGEVFFLLAKFSFLNNFLLNCFLMLLRVL